MMTTSRTVPKDEVATAVDHRARPHGEGRRAQIIAAALEIMATEGLYQTTTRKIAAAAGVNVATLHYHFHDKEEIITCVMQELIDKYRSRLSSCFSAPQSLHDRIAELLQFISREIESAPGEQLLLQEMTIYMLRTPHAAQLARDKDRDFLRLYVDTLGSATDLSEGDRPFIVALADFVYTGVIGVFNQWLATQDQQCLEAALRNLISAAQHAAAARAWPGLPYDGVLEAGPTADIRAA